MRDMTEGVEGDDFMDRDVLEADGVLAIEAAMMVEETGRIVIVDPGVSLDRRVELAPNKVRFTIRVSLEGAKIQNN